MRYFTALGAAAVCLLLFACGNQEPLGNIHDTGDTVYVADTLIDTLIVTDTLYDTTVVPIDTFFITDTLYDTSWIPVGRPEVILFGSVMAYKNYNAIDQLVDSTQVSVTAFSAGSLGQLQVKFNNHIAPPTGSAGPAQLFYNLGFWTPHVLDAPFLSNMIGETYVTAFPAAGTTFACSVIVSYYTSDTGHVLAYDTLTDAITLPDAIDTLRFYHSNGTAYDSIDYADYYYGYIDTVYRIHFDRDLEMKWARANTDWFVVHVEKILDMGYYGSYLIGEPIDTFTVDSQFNIPQSYIYQPDTTEVIDSVSYSYLYVAVIPVNGPPPSEWTTLDDFNGSGRLFGFTRSVGVAYPLADPWYGAKTAKALAGRATGPQDVHDLQRVMRSFLDKYGAK
jgi:hypothetical protein